MNAFLPTANLSVLAAYFGAWEFLLIVAVVLILVGARKPPESFRGFGKGLFQFRKAIRDLTEELDQPAHDAGESLGGIYGRPAAQALTHDNQVAELYKPAAFQDKRGRSEKHRWFGIWRRILRFLSERRRSSP